MREEIGKMDSTTLVLVSSLVEQSESRLNVVLSYLKETPELLTSPVIANKIEELRNSLNEVDSLLKKR